jgi:hypothetical protein
MSTILYTSTYGSNDPTRSTHAFLAAVGAVEAGHHLQTLCKTLHETL